METFAKFAIELQDVSIPTRWGSHLNGNRSRNGCTNFMFIIPTRWGSHLNENVFSNGSGRAALASLLAGDLT
ncbi:hypothetical protein [Chamaesiphon sp.]|uniref:hypothetical protein n=1 Tax=Chamaesiphon sp. TaxID=2814140 RepID=UPI0035939407